MEFQRVAQGIEVSALCAALDADPSLWDANTLRQDYPGSAHRDTKAIFLRWCRKMDVASAFCDLEAIDWPALDKLPPARYFLAQASSLLNATIARAMVVSLRRIGYVEPHADEGVYAEKHRRFHLVLRASPGVRFNVGSKSFEGLPGELWWFDHRRMHSVVNLSAGDRWHLIFDTVSA